MKPRILIALVVTAALASTGAVAWRERLLPASITATPAAAPAAGAPAPAAPARVSLTDFSGLVSHYGPAVVNISVTSNVKAAAWTPFPGGANPGDPFFEFFRGFRMPEPGKPVPMRGQGSGFIVSPDGYILTNAHVVDDASEVTVKLTDRREFRAKVVGADPQSDVALLRIDAKGLPTVRLGSSAGTSVGEWVVAIGSPYGFENTVTAGIVSAKSRSLPDGGFVPFIQTDAAVNPGNSGGPLFNLAGEVIGINSQIYSRTGGFQGLSFAVPIEIALKVKDELVAHGKVTRGRLGVTIQEVNAALAESFGLDRPRGALVASVEKGSPAERAGIEPGDVITAMEGKAIERSSDLPVLVAETPPGRKAELEVWRKGAGRKLAVTVGERQGEKVAAAEGDGAPSGRLGLAVRPLTREERREAGAKDGLVVEDVGGPAGKAGIQQGDILLALNGHAVTSPEQLRELVAKGGKHVAILVERDGNRLFVPVDLG
ncbi:MAG: DegQ family serine endoprotease [Burkholderiales bacterium]|nr:DegQ family serine endoprotease [Burkholderiales bacterium]